MKKQTAKCWEHFKLFCCCRDGKPNYKHNASTAEKILASQRVLEWFTEAGTTKNTIKHRALDKN